MLFPFWKWQVAGCLMLAMLSKVVEDKAAMRGAHRNALPPWLDRFLRFAFLVVVLGPSFAGIDLYIGFPVMSALLVLYLFPFCDLQEQRGGRTNLIMVLHCRRCAPASIDAHAAPAARGLAWRGVHLCGVARRLVV
jgi:hypothetical protein